MINTIESVRSNIMNRKLFGMFRIVPGDESSWIIPYHYGSGPTKRYYLSYGFGPGRLVVYDPAADLWFINEELSPAGEKLAEIIIPYEILNTAQRISDESIYRVIANGVMGWLL